MEAGRQQQINDKLRRLGFVSARHDQVSPRYTCGRKNAAGTQVSSRLLGGANEVKPGELDGGFGCNGNDRLSTTDDLFWIWSMVIYYSSMWLHAHTHFSRGLALQW